MRNFSTLVLLSLLTSVARPAFADERSVAREHYQKGTKEFDLGLYEDAITDLMAAYKAVADPAFLYNIAQAHRLAGHSVEALRFYRVFLTKVPRASNRDDVELKMAELQKAIEQQKKTQTQLPPDQVLKPAQSETVKAEAEEPPPPPKPVVVLPPPDSRPAHRLKIAGVATMGAGVLVVAVGVVSAVLGSQTADSISRSPTFDPKQLDSYRTYQALEGAFLGLGAVALVSGAIIYGVGWQRSHSPRLTVAPMAFRTGGGATVLGTW